MSANGYYNGFGPADRNGTLAIVRAALADGTLSTPTQCSVCGQRPSKPLQWHSEDYRTPLDARPICRSCHVRVHARFRHPDRWHEYVRQFDPVGWFQHLSVDPRSLTLPFDETYPDGRDNDAGRTAGRHWAIAGGEAKGGSKISKNVRE